MTSTQFDALVVFVRSQAQLWAQAAKHGGSYSTHLEQELVEDARRELVDEDDPPVTRDGKP